MTNSENNFASVSVTDRERMLATLRESIPRARQALQTLERMEQDILIIEVKEARPSVPPPPPSAPTRLIDRLVLKS